MSNEPDLTVGAKAYEGDLAIVFENFRPINKEDFRELMASVGLPTEMNVFTDGHESHMVPFIVTEEWGDGCAVVLGLDGSAFLIAHGHDCPRTMSVLATMVSATRGESIVADIKDCPSAETGMYAGQIDGEYMRKTGMDHSRE